ncbi:uncharacterized protein LOC62_07G008945 [Vanrija pseudolonga]|uniref:Uncharacterized protein n=1 Tax=Vanrija pseudolonga TaxID=143232 RepID=A0AAF0YIV0_9TREE|nr:hypothetical protein LOC62_07G008945 [Vanrija pseudolonga]
MSAVLDPSGFPHILDNILGHLPWSALPPLRAVSKAMDTRIKAVMYRHVVLHFQWAPETDQTDIPVLHIVDPYYFRPLPGLNCDFDGWSVHMETFKNDDHVVSALRFSIPDSTIVRVYLNQTAGLAPLRLRWFFPNPFPTGVAIYPTPLAPQIPRSRVFPSRFGLAAVQIHGVPSDPNALVILVRKPEDLTDTSVSPLDRNRNQQDLNVFMQVFEGRSYTWWTHVKILVVDESDRTLARGPLLGSLRNDYCQANSVTADQVFALTIRPGTPLPAPRSWTDLPRRPLTASLAPIDEAEEEDDKEDKEYKEDEK